MPNCKCSRGVIYKGEQKCPHMFVDVYRSVLGEFVLLYSPNLVPRVFDWVQDESKDLGNKVEIYLKRQKKKEEKRKKKCTKPHSLIVS